MGVLGTRQLLPYSLFIADLRAFSFGVTVISAILWWLLAGEHQRIDGVFIQKIATVDCQRYLMR